MIANITPFARYAALIIAVAVTACASGSDRSARSDLTRLPPQPVRILPSSAWAARLNLAGHAEEDTEVADRVVKHLDDAATEVLTERGANILPTGPEDQALGLALRDYLYLALVEEDDTAEPPAATGERAYGLAIYQRVELSDRSNRAAQLVVSALLLTPSRPHRGHRSTMAALMDLSTGEIVWRERLDGGDPTRPAGARKLVERLLLNWPHVSPANR